MKPTSTLKNLLAGSSLVLIGILTGCGKVQDPTPHPIVDTYKFAHPEKPTINAPKSKSVATQANIPTPHEP